MKYLQKKLLLALIAGFFLLTSCTKEIPITEVYVGDSTKYDPKPYTIVSPWYFPSQMNIPADNPLTVDGVFLGRTLFYDLRFSGYQSADSQMCCATCHLQENAFKCGMNGPFPNGHPVGITGIATPHVMLPVVDLVWQKNGYLWNGLLNPNNPNPYQQRLEDVVEIVVEVPFEMHSDTNKARNGIAAIPGYKPLFKKAFNTENISFKLMAKAVAQFIRSIVSVNSKFDQYLLHQTSLTTSEANGFVLFVTEQGADCFHCHGGDGNPLLTTYQFYNNAKDTVFTDPNDRYGVTGDPMDHGAYLAPSLRNCELTAPYMHDGRYTTLDEVIDFYSEGLKSSPYASPLMHKLANGGAHLTPQGKADLKAFLLTLTDHDLTSNPAYGPPPSFP